MMCAIRRKPIQALAPYRYVLLALSAPLLSVLISQAVTGGWHATELEKAARLSLGLPVVLYLFAALDQAALRHAVWGILLAGWASTIKVVWLVYPRFSRPPTQEYNAVGYGNLMLLMAALTVYSLVWQLTRHPRAEKCFKWLTVAVTSFGFVLTQTRTGWLAVPVFVLIAVALFGHFRHPRRAICIFLGAVVVIMAVGAASPALRDRAGAMVREARECQEQNKVADTSICIRLQLWRSAWNVFENAPGVGMGSNRFFEDKLRERAKEGEVSPYVAENFGEPHNDILAALSSYGLPGGVALLLMYFAPAWFFLRRLTRRHPAQQRAAAAMGLAVCLGFALFGLSEFMFRGMRTIGAYAVLLALFMALSSAGDKHETAAPVPR